MRTMNAALVLFIYSIISIGFAYIIGHSVATQKLREIAFGPLMEDESARLEIDPASFIPRTTLRRLPVRLVECPACLGFWTGAMVGWWISDYLPIQNWIVILSLALYTTGSNLVLGKLTRLMD